MAIRINNVEYLSYEEQVLQNKEDIKELKGGGIILDERKIVTTLKPNQTVSFSASELPSYAKLFLEIDVPISGVGSLLFLETEFPILDMIESLKFRCGTVVNWQGQTEIVYLDFIEVTPRYYIPKLTISGNTQYDNVRLVLRK